MFSNLLREDKVVEIAGVNFRLKKWPKRLKDWLTMRLIETATFNPDADDGAGGYEKPRPMARPFEEVEEETLEKVYLGVESWGLLSESGSPVPITRQSVRELYSGFPGVFSALYVEVNVFNTPLSAKEGESFPSTSTT